MNARSSLLAALALTALASTASTASAAEIARYRVTIEGDDGRYLIADNDAAKGLSADSTDPTGSREHFTLIEHDNGTFNLQAYHGYFVSAKQGWVQGRQPVLANRNAAGSWERFYPEAGQVLFDAPQTVGTHHGTLLRQQGDDLDAYFAWAEDATNDLVVRKEGFAARFLNPSGHTQRSDGSVDYVGDVEIPAADGQAMILTDATVNYRRDQSGAFTRFSGASDDLLLLLDGRAADLGVLESVGTTFDLLNPSGTWPTSVPRGERYLRIYNTNVASWGPVEVAPTGWGKRAMVFDHNDGTVHLRGQIDLGSGQDVAWMAVGPAADCDLSFERGGVIVDGNQFEANVNMCLTMEDSGLSTAQGSDWIRSLHIDDDAVVRFNREGHDYELELLDAAVAYFPARADLQLAGELTGTIALPHNLSLVDVMGTVRTFTSAAQDVLHLDVVDTALGTSSDSQIWRFTGGVTLGSSQMSVLVVDGDVVAGDGLTVRAYRQFDQWDSAADAWYLQASTRLLAEGCTVNGSPADFRVTAVFKVAPGSNGLLVTQVASQCAGRSVAADLVYEAQSDGRMAPMIETLEDRTGFVAYDAGVYPVYQAD